MNTRPAILLAAVAVGTFHGLSLAQNDFRRGDANADGVVDIADVSFTGRFLFQDGQAPACLSSADADGNGTLTSFDNFALFTYLFGVWPPPPPPGPDEPGPDPNPAGLPCASYEPEPPARLGDFSLGFGSHCPVRVVGTPGETVTFRLFARLTSAAESGAEGWSIGIGAENLRVVDATTTGTDVPFSPFRFSKTGPVDPDADTGDGPQGEGAVSAVVLSERQTVSLPSEGTARILALTLEATVPDDDIGAARVRFVDGKRRFERPVPNVVVVQGSSQRPELGSCEILLGDCNGNGRPDSADIASGASADENADGIPDECADCNGNGILDDEDISHGDSTDMNTNGIPDECEDCNDNGAFDDEDIARGDSVDVDTDGIPDECEPDCNDNGVPDDFDITTRKSTDLNGNTIPDECEDCNENGVPDDVDLSDGASEDVDGDGIPDECTDCNANGTVDLLEIRDGDSADCNANGVPDECEDCDGSGVPDPVEIGTGVLEDCSGNGVPDSCEPDCNGNGVPDDCDEDADGNGIPDDCETEPSFVYRIRSPDRVSSESFQAIVELHSLGIEPGEAGVQGWSIGLRGFGCTITGATTAGTSAGLASEGPPGLRGDSSFEKTEIVDPERNNGRRGVFSSVVLSFPPGDQITLDPVESPHDVLSVTVAAPIPEGEDCDKCTLRFDDNLVRGLRFANEAVFEDVGHRPILGRKSIFVCREDVTVGECGGTQLPGDCNQDGMLDISDGICLLGHLFLGNPDVLPCDDDQANVTLVDANGGGAVDLSDAVYLFTFLFLGGPPHALGSDCVPIAGCPRVCSDGR